MVDDTTPTGTEPEEELVIVETPPGEDTAAGGEAEGDEDEGDERLTQSQDDLDEEVSTSQTAKQRKERKERQRRAREANERELIFLREQVTALSQRVSATEGHAVTTQAQSIRAAYAAALEEAKQAEYIMAKALEAGNGEDHVAAQRIRDAANQRAAQAAGIFNQLQQASQQVAAPTSNPVVQNHAAEWTRANPWYNPAAADEDSAIVNAIDAAMTKQGYDPSQRGYWEELTRRVSARFGPADDADPVADSPRRKAPPQGSTREHAPTSTRKEIYVTPERKQAMIDAGVWDDPARRNQMLKAYQEYDRQNTAR